MKHLGKYQCSLGKLAYIPEYTINYEAVEEPHLFTDEQLVQFFAKVDFPLPDAPIIATTHNFGISILIWNSPPAL